MSKDTTKAKKPNEVLRLRLQAAFAEYEAAIVSERIKLGLRLRRDNTKKVVS